jgi:glutathione S-transferase
MRTLYHLWLSPACRKVRLVLGEKKLDADCRIEPVWERREPFLTMNPAGEVPVMVEPEGAILCDGTAIAEYLDETTPAPPLNGTTPMERAEVRRLVGWFDGKFNDEVTANLVGEKVLKRLMRTGYPSSDAIRAGLSNIRYHLEYIGFLAERRNWLAGNRLSLADITAAAHLSCIDYIGDVPWAHNESAKTWYARIKSRPSFRPILADTVPGIAPVETYANLDF